jgi:hypothetical protein
VDHPLIDDAIKVRLADTIRRFYRAHPDAQDFLARGRVVPPTVANHGFADGEAPKDQRR